MSKKSATKDEIDDIFSDVKAKKKAKTKVLNSKDKQETSKDEERKKSHKKIRLNEDNNLSVATSSSSSSSTYGIIKSEIAAYNITSPEAPLERIDKESGLPVYKAHLLKVGEGGGTPLCPFDCDCCF